MYGLVVGDLLVILIGIRHWAKLHAGAAACALVFDDVTRFFGQSDGKVTCLSFNTVNDGISENFNIGMPADLDQFR